MSEPLRLLCDEMLGRLARYLRAAGHDTALASGGTQDRDLLQRARDEHRRFLTCDRRIAEHKAAAGIALILPRGSLDASAAALTAALGVDWLHAPFTRCLVDNEPLVPRAASHEARVPRDVPVPEARHCPACGRIYWAGSHHRRMRARLAAWAGGHFHPTGTRTGARAPSIIRILHAAQSRHRPARDSRPRRHSLATFPEEQCVDLLSPPSRRARLRSSPSLRLPLRRMPIPPSRSP